MLRRLGLSALVLGCAAGIFANSIWDEFDNLNGDYDTTRDSWKPFELPEETPVVVLAVAGGKVALPCNITPPTHDDDVSLILWYKDESPTPIYSLDSRRGSLGQARHAASDVLAHRAYLSAVHKPASLHLDPVLEEDQGEYRCRVDFRKARTRHDVIYMQIIVPPEKPIIMDQNGEVLQNVIGPFNEGDRLHLICEAEGGKPTPSLTWLKNMILLDDSYDLIRPGMVRNELYIPSLERNDLMADFSCQASNNNISVPTSTSVTIDLNFRPTKVHIEGNRRPLSAEKTVEVTCRTAGSRPPATITWWKGSAKMKRAREKVAADKNTTISVLTFSPSSDDNGKYLSCRAENPLIPGSAIEDTWKLEVHYVPQLTLRLGSKLRHSHIQEGNDVYFECNIRASPWVTEIRWWFESREIHTNATARMIVSNQSLVLQRVQRTHRGRYTCSATNTEGEGESNTVHLRVQYAPSCKPGQKMLYGAARNEAVHVTCEVDADPSDVIFTWLFNNSANNLEVTTFVSDGPTSVATYIPRSEFDYGTLSCTARNNVGVQQEPCFFTVIPAGPPDNLRNCTVTNQSEDTLHVECLEGYDGGLLQHFVMEVHDTHANKLRANITSIAPSFLARSLPPGKTYLIIIYAANAKGRSKHVVMTANTLAAPGSLTRKGNTWQIGLNPVLAVLVFLVVVFMMAALAIVLVLKFKQRRDMLIREEMKPKKESLEVQYRKEEKCDVCTYSGGESDDKCPDIIPDIGVVRSENDDDDNESNAATKAATDTQLNKHGSADKDVPWTVERETSAREGAGSNATFPRLKNKTQKNVQSSSSEIPLQEKTSPSSGGTTQSQQGQRRTIRMALTLPRRMRSVDNGGFSPESPNGPYRQTDV